MTNDRQHHNPRQQPEHDQPHQQQQQHHHHHQQQQQQVQNPLQIPSLLAADVDFVPDRQPVGAAVDAQNTLRRANTRREQPCPVPPPSLTDLFVAPEPHKENRDESIGAISSSNNNGIHPLYRSGTTTPTTGTVVGRRDADADVDGAGRPPSGGSTVSGPTTSRTPSVEEIWMMGQQQPEHQQMRPRPPPATMTRGSPEESSSSMLSSLPVPLSRSTGSPHRGRGSPSPPTSTATVPRPGHQRNVSWKFDTVVVDRPRALADRQLSDFTAASASPSFDPNTAASAAWAAGETEFERLRYRPPYHQSSASFANRGGNVHHNRRQYPFLPSTNTSSAAEIIRDHLHQASPLECEAEACILRAIERSDPPRPRSDSHATIGSSVLPHVPDEAVANLVAAVAEPPSLHSVDGEGGAGGSLLGDEASLGGGTANTVRSGATAAGHAASTSRRPLLAARPAVLTHQKRQQTMEEKLCGLTSELDAIQSAATAAPTLHFAEPQHPPASSTTSSHRPDAGPAPLRRRTNTLESVGGPATNDDDGDGPVPTSVSSSADAFQQSASILSRRMTSERHLATAAVAAGKPSTPHPASAGTAPQETTSWFKGRSVRNLLSEASHKKLDDAPGATTTNKDPKEEDDDDDLDFDLELQSIPEDDREDEVEAASSSEDKRAGGSASGFQRRLRNSRRGRTTRQASAFEEWKLARDFKDAFLLMKRPIRLFLKISVLYVMIPAIFVAAVLFYFAGNPPTGILQNGGNPVNATLRNLDGAAVSPTEASVSWWLLFLGVRQLMTLSLALFADFVLIDYLSVRSGTMYRAFGAWPTLFVLQSRGWPFAVFFWSVFDFALLYGSAPFFQHWLWWQEPIGLFNLQNPGGGVVDSLWYRRILAISISVSAVVAVKRFVMGLYFGRKTFLQYSDKLASVMKKIILISQVAHLSCDLERQCRSRSKTGSSGESHGPRESMVSKSVLSEDRLGALFQNADDGCSDASPTGARSDRSVGWNDDPDLNKMAPVIDPDDRHPLTGKLNAAQKSRIVQLLGAWEEPTTAETTVELVSVSALLHFRRALACLRTDFPFSASFGPAGTREDTITSSQEVYERLMLGSDDASPCLNFHVLALLGMLSDGSLDQDKLLDLIRVFRPDRDGTLSIVDFVKSVDAVYRELRLLRASVNNSTKIDTAFENIFNIFFYGLIIVVVLSQLGFDPLAMFLSISGVILAFAFMIGAASSKYFEGVLFILMRRPYEIGDGIHVSDVNAETLPIGSDCWVVKDVTLFSTTVVFVRTKEQATMSNGSLASSRIINSSRSVHASLFCLIKFPIDVPYAKLKLFQEALQTYIRNRPREWLGFTTFRVNRIETAEGFIEYMFVGTHRESWYHLGALRDSLGSLLSFTVELGKKLEIAYQKPPMPVNLSLLNGHWPSIEPVPSGNSNRADTAASSPRSTGSMDYSTDLRGLHAMFTPAHDAYK